MYFVVVPPALFVRSQLSLGRTTPRTPRCAPDGKNRHPIGRALDRPHQRLTMEFVVIARYRARTGEEGRVEEALRKMVAPTRAEPGNLDYQVFRDPGQPEVFVLFERYADAKAFEAHRA